jgi:hypothetical protein
MGKPKDVESARQVATGNDLVRGDIYATAWDDDSLDTPILHINFAFSSSGEILPRETPFYLFVGEPSPVGAEQVCLASRPGR